MSAPTRDELLPKALEIANRVLNGDASITPRQHEMAVVLLRGWAPKVPLPKGKGQGGGGALHIHVGEHLPDDDPELLAELNSHRTT